MSQTLSENAQTPPNDLPVNPAPYVPPPPVGPRREIVALSFADPFRWIRRGARDLQADLAQALQAACH